MIQYNSLLIWRSTNAVRFANDPYTFISVKKVVKYFFFFVRVFSLYNQDSYSLKNQNTVKNQTMYLQNIFFFFYIIQTITC